MIQRLNVWLSDMDESLTERISVADQKGPLRSAAIAITHTGDVLAFLGVLGAIALIGSPEWLIRVIVLTAGDLLAFLTIQGQKFAIRRQRPEGEWGERYRRVDPHSFPSGHAGRGGVMAALGVIVGPAWFGALLLVWGIAVAASRVFMGVHYLTDSLAGFLVGSVMGVALGIVLGLVF